MSIPQSFGHFQLLERLGEGGMGVVWKARDSHLDRFVAIKVLRSNMVADPDRRRRFILEAKAASALNHPNIVTIHDIAEANGELYIVMEHVAGHTLDREIDIAQGLVSHKLALHYAIQIADALAKAHSVGIIHRDLKPANILLTPENTVKLLDFGLAKLVERKNVGDDDATVTQPPETETGVILGTVSYMSPEQAQGLKVDVRSDIFSFGAVLYELVTGRQAFAGNTRISRLVAVVNEEPKSPSELRANLSRDLEKIILRCLRKEPERRAQSMADVRVLLRDLSDDAPREAVTPPTAAPRMGRGTWIAAAVSLLAGAGAVWMLRPPETAPVYQIRSGTTYPGRVFSPALSPDGRQLAFTWSDAGFSAGAQPTGVYVKPADGGSPPLRLADGIGSVSWSPDGSRIAFMSEGALNIVPVLGGPLRQIMAITRDNFAGLTGGTAWSPDGKWIAATLKDKSTQTRGIVSVALDTGETRSLTRPADARHRDINPVFSADGSRLTFVRNTSLYSGYLYMVRLDREGKPQGNEERITEKALDVRGLGWLPDGRYLAVMTVDGAESRFWRIPASGGPARELPLRFRRDSMSTSENDLSLRAGRLAVNVLHNANGIAQIGLDERNHWKLQPFAESSHTDQTMEYSPDGKAVVFVSNRSGSTELWRSKPDGTEALQLTGRGGSPKWSPDGRQIVFDAYEDGSGDIYTVSAQGGTPRRLTTGPANDNRPYYSSDGRWIYFYSNRSINNQIWKIPATGGEIEQVTKNGGVEPRLSADGKWLFYVKPGGRGIWRSAVDGSGETQMLKESAEGYWTVGPRKIIYFNALRDAILELDMEDGKGREIFRLPERMLPVIGNAPDLSISSDERSILFVYTKRAGSDILLVDGIR